MNKVWTTFQKIDKQFLIKSKKKKLNVKNPLSNCITSVTGILIANKISAFIDFQFLRNLRCTRTRDCFLKPFFRSPTISKPILKKKKKKILEIWKLNTCSLHFPMIYLLQIVFNFWILRSNVG